MTTVRFLRNGAETAVEAPPGARLLDVAQAAGQPLEGTCGGQMACGTCHVAIGRADRARIPAAGPDEEDMLDLVHGATGGSRLACQVPVPEGSPFTVTVLA